MGNEKTKKVDFFLHVAALWALFVASLVEKLFRGVKKRCVIKNVVNKRPLRLTKISN